MSRASNFGTRTAIRKKIAEILTNKTDAGANVFPTFARPTQLTEWPAIFIYSEDEEYSKLRQGNGSLPPLLRRDLVVKIEIFATDTDQGDLVDILDTIAEQVENEINEKNDLEGLVHEIGLDAAKGVFGVDGSRPEGVWIMTYAVTYVKKPGGS